VGWIIPAKGVEVLVDAWARARPPPEWRLEFIGPGDAEYTRRLRSRAPGSRIDFAGELPHSEAMLRMARADVVVLPSFSEGFPNVVVEAMALGKPIVASAVGAIPEMLVDGSGIVVPPGDAEALARSLSNLMHDDALRRSLAASAQARAAGHYSIDAVFQRYVSVWRGIRAT
jgi:glycosyltransferase involved in cell wall biosynthesis